MSARADALARALPDDVDALLVSAPANVRYLTGYTGSNGAALVARDGARDFFTDFRYDEQSAAEVDAAFTRHVVTGDLLQAAVTDGGSARYGFESADLSVRRHGALAEKLPDGATLVACDGLVESLREVKDADELRAIMAAAQLVDEILGWASERGLAGRTERQLALEIEHEMRLRGAEGPSFATIVASGAHGSLPHAQPRDQPIERDAFVTIDLGAIVDGYCSDCTRTFAVGQVDEQAREIYRLVLEAQRAGVDAARAGRNGREIDAVARAVIEDAGHGDHFGHGLGHGVGLEIHEGPRLSRTAPEDPLRAGTVVTVEPGVYLPGRLGVRIEDLVVVGEDGARSLSRFTTELLSV